MKNISLLLLLALSGFLFNSCEEVDEAWGLNDLTDEEVVEGLKSALNVGTDTSVTTLNALDGYYGDDLVKILLPEEASVILDNISKVPLGDNLLEAAVLSINRAAEDAAIEAKPIFVNAITGLTIQNGFQILHGADDAATVYLKNQTTNDLVSAFTPKIETSLNKKIVGNVSAESAYSNLVTAYNTASLGGVLFPQVTTNTLAQHTTEKALEGLFTKVAKEELLIRTDLSHRVNEILLKVFGDI
jgi:hypothetical protein